MKNGDNSSASVRSGLLGTSSKSTLITTKPAVIDSIN